MASIYKRKNGNGTSVWRAVIRIKGYPTVCNHFERKQEAEDWALNIKKAWQQALKRANITDCRAHDMRHTFCTYAAAMGASNLQLQTATGHRTLNMLLHYTHMDVEVTKQFSNQISDQILKGNSLWLHKH